jgi:3-deoxy-D-manno-octulosonate 8-phosphate phosphatase (KDO 8-P phosphatase)
MSSDRAQKIKVILFDVDGVLTDGSIWLFPAPDAGERGGDRHASERAGDGSSLIQSSNMIEAKGFNAHDGTAISLAHLGGLKAGVVTKRVSEAVALRARDLKLDYVFQGIDRKADVLDKILSEGEFQEEEICFVGDDVIDLPIMRRCGLAIAVANARPQVMSIAHYTTPSRGGQGAARDAIEYVLKAQGKLDAVIEAYVSART